MYVCKYSTYIVDDVSAAVTSVVVVFVVAFALVSPRSVLRCLFVQIDYSLCFRFFFSLFPILSLSLFTERMVTNEMEKETRYCLRSLKRRSEDNLDLEWRYTM